MAASIDVLQSKLIKRGVDMRFLDYGKLEQASKGTVRQVVTIKSGLPTETAKKIVKLIKDKGLKVQRPDSGRAGARHGQKQGRLAGGQPCSKARTWTRPCSHELSLMLTAVEPLKFSGASYSFSA